MSLLESNHRTALRQLSMIGFTLTQPWNRYFPHVARCCPVRPLSVSPVFLQSILCPCEQFHFVFHGWFSPLMLWHPSGSSQSPAQLHCCVISVCGVFGICLRNWVIQLHFGAQQRVVNRPEGSWINSCLSGALFLLLPHMALNTIQRSIIYLSPRCLPSFRPGFSFQRRLSWWRCWVNIHTLSNLKHRNTFHVDPQWKTWGNILIINFKLNFLLEVGNNRVEGENFHHLFPRLLTSCMWIVAQQTWAV